MENRIRQILLCCAVLLAGVPFVRAQQQASEELQIVFRFVGGDDMFYVPWNGNGKELSRLLECVEQNKSAILNGSIPLLVDGYCNSKDTSKRLTMAKTRSNRVKTELILHGGLTEGCFITKNHTSGGNYVTVRIMIPSGPSATELEAQRKAEEERLAAERANRIE